MFKKDEYIVTLWKTVGTSCAKDNYIFKQREKYDYLKPYIDLDGDGGNGNNKLPFNNPLVFKWRYATPQEIAEYERLGKPFDVTELKSEIYEIF